MIKQLIDKDNALLHREVKDVTVFDDSLKALIQDLEDSLYHYNGVGIAAPQIGVDLKVALVDMEQDGILQLINPEITYYSKEQASDVEGCLSVPDVFGLVDRSTEITVKANDLEGNEIEMTAYDDIARIIQHEVDHLYGKLFTDKVTRFISEDELEAMYDEEA
ncbi:peptide deformylase [Macrococcoides caseolyticum]|uniref:peptide deformylase n=1 Tax=Macrococcoides caseolyticum TaxID=69966 RepID=UPI001F3B88F4|nr:peptide deformylase [Macrococcus caseolyticus]MCE4956802.1 peptide deformylase [Macrococcus caseolyticus]